MYKVITFTTGQSPLSNFFAEAIDITPSGGGLTKVAGVMHPEITAFMKMLRPDKDFQYVLMTPMGAWEFWGMNVNGDIFPEISLSYDMTKGNPVPVALELERRFLTPFKKKLPPGNYTTFGYRTFLAALRYLHHVNKNPEIAYGDIPLSVWNPTMHRVEVIVRHDREKAKQVGASDVISDIDKGISREISMGCKVPFDVCTVCGHISRTPSDYCIHLRTQMGKVLPDGRLVGAANFFPRFFDLSDVFVPAAKESAILMKVAEVYTRQGLAARAQKTAEITKRVVPNAGQQVIGDVCGREQDLPRGVLRTGDFGDLLSTLALLGIVLRPREFQYGMLHRMGQGSTAEGMASKCCVFSPASDAPHASLSAKSFRPSMANSMERFLGKRSAFYPHLPHRIVAVSIKKGDAPLKKHALVENTGLLSKVAAAYASYRSAFRDLPQQLDVAVSEHPDYYSRNFFGDLLTDSMEKTASSFHSATLSEPLVPLYLYNAYRDTMARPPASWRATSPTLSPARALLGPVL